MNNFPLYKRVDWVLSQSERMRALGQVVISGRFSTEASTTRDVESELVDFLQKAPIALHCLDVRGRIMWANNAEMNLLGYSTEEYVGHYMAEVRFIHCSIIIIF